MAKKIELDEEIEQKVEIDKVKSLALSEFTANQDIDLHYLNDKPCSNSVPGAINVKVKRLEQIPEIFIPTMLRNNRNFIGRYVKIGDKLEFRNDFQMKDGLPYITHEQELKYGVFFKDKQIDMPKKRFTMENMLLKSRELGEKEFKKWAEDHFSGFVNIDRRKSVRAIVEDIIAYFK